MVLVVKVRVGAVLFGVEITVVGVIVIVVLLPVSYCIVVSSGVDVDLFMDELADVSAFAVIMAALEFTVSIPLEEFGCRAAFDCRPLAL